MLMHYRWNPQFRHYPPYPRQNRLWCCKQSTKRYCVLFYLFQAQQLTPRKDLKKDDIALKHRGILYLPDFLVNRMGIVNCADEHIGTLPNDPKLELHLGKEHPNSIYCLSVHVLKEAQESGRTTQQVRVFTVMFSPDSRCV